ncbi:LysR family transcriptional regulator [Marinomonas arenicola]|uniref:LysR family transcriptional regulator n=1 Tax=Marinomonas arenicola TaxID=569601 RepID=UPI00311E164A
MNIKQLNYFLTIAECSSIASAARKLKIAQPALSLQISKLEHELKTVLFSRGSKGVRLTESGNIFKSHARLMLAQLDKAIADLSELEGSPKGTIVIAMNQATDNLLALPLCRAVEQKYPGIDLDLRTGLSYEVVNMVNRGEADLAIIYEDGQKTDNINKELLIKENLLFATKPENNDQKNTIEYKELSQYELVITSEKESQGYIIEKYEKSTGIKLNKRRPYGQLLTSLRFACEGYCHLLLPSSAFYHLEKSGLLKSFKVVEPEIYRNVYIAVDSNRPVRNISLEIIKIIKSLTKQANKDGTWLGRLPSDS